MKTFANLTNEFVLHKQTFCIVFLILYAESIQKCGNGIQIQCGKKYISPADVFLINGIPSQLNLFIRL